MAVDSSALGAEISALAGLLGLSGLAAPGGSDGAQPNRPDLYTASYTGLETES